MRRPYEAKCYWITGLPGSGKSFLADALVEALRKRGEAVLHLDGDALRAAFGERFGYHREDRVYLAMVYARLCKMFVSQGFVVVIATVSLFTKVHQWNRENIDGYFEIFLNATSTLLSERDKKSLYSQGDSLNGLITENEYAPPKCPHIEFIIGDNIDPNVLLRKIFERLDESCS